MKEYIDSIMFNTDKITLTDKTDITDPCYSTPTFTVDTLSGVYLPTVKRVFKDGAYMKNGKIIYPNEYSDCRIAEIIIRHRDYKEEGEWEGIGGIPVDAGLAGFFTNKPEYSDDEWYAFCDKLLEEDNRNEDTLIECVYRRENDFFTSSGYGDGFYLVFGIKKDNKYVALKIVFINDEEEYDDEMNEE